MLESVESCHPSKAFFTLISVVLTNLYTDIFEDCRLVMNANCKGYSTCWFISTTDCMNDPLLILLDFWGTFDVFPNRNLCIGKFIVSVIHHPVFVFIFDTSYIFWDQLIRGRQKIVHSSSSFVSNISWEHLSNFFIIFIELLIKLEICC